MNDEARRLTALYRAEIKRFLEERLQAKLDKLKDDDPKRDTLIAQHQAAAWIEDAARRVAQIQVVTHTLKPTHPDARGTNLFCRPDELAQHEQLGSHVLNTDCAQDVVGNAAALDVYKFLKLTVEDRSLLEALQAGDEAAVAALSDDPAQSQEWAAAFKAVFSAGKDLSSHALGKQLYWPVSDSATDDAAYHLLMPLYASSLAHAVHEKVNHARYNDEAKAARKARWESKPSAHGYADYPALAARKLGGTKPQNISQLNSERGGVSYLLGSLPPSWTAQETLSLWRVDSVFQRLRNRPDVRDTLRELAAFLRKNPEPTMETRDRRDVYVDALIDAVVGIAAQVQSSMPTGWSRDPKCQLAEYERLWLDPGRAESADPADTDFRQAWLWRDWPNEIGDRFGGWLNQQLDRNLPVGDPEKTYWARQLLADGEWAWRIDQDRRQIEAVEVAS